MSKFWLTFIINEALGVLDVFVQSGSLKPNQKSAAEKLILDAQAFLATL